MKDKATEPGSLETRFLSYVQFRKMEIVRTGDISTALGITKKQEHDLLSYMSKKGIIIRLMRGLYLVPKRMPAGGKFAASEHFILSKLMESLKGRYQISGPSAFRFYGFDDQIPNKVYVYNNRLSGERTIGNIEFVFIKTSDKQLGGINKFKTTDGSIAIFTSKIRTLVDAVYDWNRYNTLPRGFNWIRDELEKDPTIADELISMSIKFGNKGTLRRIGYLLETLGVKNPRLTKMKKQKGSAKSLIAWIPNKASRGSINKDWGLIINGEI